MNRLSAPALAHYSIAVAAVAVVTFLRIGLERLGLASSAPFLLFVLAVVLAGWRGGFGPAALATILSALAIDLFFLPPAFRLHVAGGEELVSLFIFLVQGFVVAWLCESNLRSLRGITEARRELEQRVRERTAAMQRSNAELLDQVNENETVTRELRSHSEQLQRSNRELQDFASVASHDLQEPLRKIQAFADRLNVRCTDSLSDEARDYLSRMQNAASRMQVLINDLLTFSRVTTRAQPFERVDLNRIAAEVVSDLEARIEETGGRVEIGDLPEIDADPLQMRQLLQNLIGNGLKFQRENQHPVVRIDAAVVDADPGENGVPVRICELRVQDNGIGFDEKYVDRIFNIFQRLHGRHVYEGTGIGLAVCRKIVERHHGTIGAISRPGEGATFVARLPLEHDFHEMRQDEFAA